MPIHTQFPSTFFRPYFFAPSNVTVPVVTGLAEVGETLTVSNGTWMGSIPITYAYQWHRNGVAIDGATNSTYQPVAADADTLLSAAVTATNDRSSTSITSEGRRVLFEDTFTRANGAVGNDWQGNVTSATITSNQLVITPAVGTNLFANPGFDADTDWTHNADYTIASGVATKNNTNVTALSQAGLLTLNQFYTHTVGTGTSTNSLFYINGLFTGANVPLHTRDGVPSGLSGWARQTAAGFITISASVNLDNVAVQPITSQVIWRTQSTVEGLATLTVRFTAPVSASLNAANTGVAHFLDDENYVAAIFDRSAASQTTACIALIVVTSNLVTVLGSSNLSALPTTNTDYVLSLARSGSTYTVTLGGNTLLSAPLSPDFLASSTRWGILGNNQYWLRQTNYTFQGTTS